MEEKMLSNECYKVFIKQKMWIFIMIMLFLRIVMVVTTGYDSHYMIDENERYYLEYLKKYGGKITEGIEKRIEEEYKKINLTDGQLLASEQKKRAFQIIYDQYCYQKEKGGGYLLDTRGWSSILEKDDLDYCLILCVIIFLTSIWAYEYEHEMDIIHRSCKEGKYRTSIVKTGLGIVCSVILFAVFQGVEIIYLLATVGLRHGNYPLKSLVFYQDGQYHISLNEALCITIGIRLVGIMLMSVMAMFFAVCIKKRAISMVVSMAAVILTEIALKDSSLIYNLPIPHGPLKGTGYLWPSMYVYRTLGTEKEKVCTFREIPFQSFVVMIVLFLMEIIIFSMMCIIVFSGWKPRLKHPIKMKKIKTFILILLTIPILCSCQFEAREISVVIEKDDSQTQAKWNDVEIEIDFERNNIVCKKQSEKSEYLIRDVFPSELSIKRIFVYDGYCYYLSENDEDDGVCVRKINLDYKDDTLVYSSADKNIEDYFGLIKEDENFEDVFYNMEETKWFFVADQYIYLKKKYYIMQINIRTGTQKIVAEGVADERVSYQNGKLEYINAEGEKAVI